MKNNGRILLLPLLLAAFLLTPGMLSAQRSGSEKKERIRIPPAALRPFHNEEFFSNEVKAFKTCLESLELPPTLEEFQKKAEDFAPAIGNEFRVRFMNFRSIALHPDLEEVTRNARSWYSKIHDTARPILTVAPQLSNMMESGDEQRYQAVKRTLDDAKAETLALLKKPRKLRQEELEIIAAKNRARREKEYIKWYQAKQAEEQKKAREKAAAKKKSGRKQKKQSEEMEEK